MILLFHRDTLPFDFLDVKSEAPEHIEAVALADFGVVVIGSRGRVEYATAYSKVNESKLEPVYDVDVNDEDSGR